VEGPLQGPSCKRARSRQGRTALGIDAQKEKVKAFLDGGRWQLVKSFTETESGKRSDRPELRKALDYCKRNKGTKPVVATLSRSSRPICRTAKAKHHRRNSRTVHGRARASHGLVVGCLLVPDLVPKAIINVLQAD
jgi:hypothetical protein